MSEPRKHHFVAQLYQRGFARQSTAKSWQVKVVNRNTGEGGIRNVRDAFAQRDWNTIVDPEGNKEFGAERLLAEHIEAPAAPALEDLRKGRFPLLEWRREALAMFMSAQLSRGRIVRESLAQSISEVTRLMVMMAAAHYSDEQWVEAIGEVPSEDAKARLLNNEDHFHVRPTNAMLLHALLGSTEEVAGVLHQRTWTLVCFAKPWLFTGEAPVIHMNPSGEQLGFGAATAEQMYMPVSPSRALLLSHPWTSWPEAKVDGTRELAERLNWAMLTYPSNNELLLDPDIEAHPLPSVAVLASGEWWPWGEDPEAKPPVYMEVLRREVPAPT
jgi:hypothetical protein